MIKANELRIGNYIYIEWSKEYRKVDDLDIRDIAENRNYVQEQAKPIPLTPEILEMAGFKPLAHSEFYEVINGNVILSIYPPNGYCFIDIRGRSQMELPRPVNHLHDLQNLYFALTATELEINLNKEK